jgi:hypothetical protein
MKGEQLCWDVDWTNSRPTRHRWVGHDIASSYELSRANIINIRHELWVILLSIASGTKTTDPTP